MVAQPVPIASFARLPAGWEQLQGASGAVALSWRYRPNSNGWAPAMPRGGIAVDVLVLQDRPRYPRLRLVLPRRPAGTLEGAPDTPEYRIDGRVGGRDVEIRVDIRNPYPSARQLRLAQRAVTSVRFS